MKKYNVAIVGVGSVGLEMLRVLEQRQFPIDDALKVLGRSQRRLTLDDKKYLVEEISYDKFNNVDIALFAGTEGEKGAAVTFAKEAIKRGAIVIDNGADFRLDPDVPLVVPEVNPDDIKWHKGLIANPNCSTIQMVVALAPIHKAVRIKRIIVSTYQAVSGAGRGAVEQLEKETKEIVLRAQGSGFRAQEGVLPHRIAFNIFPHIGKFEHLGFTSEEWKMVKETHKIMHDDTIKISATAVRVPVFNGHSESIYIETEKPLAPDAAREILLSAPGVKVIDDIENNQYPMSKDCDGRDEVFVGRIRRDPYVECGLHIWVVSDNLRKGAALNAVQIAERLVAK